MIPSNIKVNNINKCNSFALIALIALIIVTALLSFTAFNAFCSSDLPEKVDLPVPFLCQAPFGDWSHPWQDACEEANIIMAMKYVKGEPLTSKSGNFEILDLIEFQVIKYGGHYDLTAKQTVKLIKDFYKYGKVEVSYEVSIEDIKKNLAEGNIVIAPMAGRLLGNPYYTPPGPAYHMMLFKGYDDRRSEFITNDPGTRHGKDYRFKYAVAYNAIHDWTGSKETIAEGRKAMIVFLK
ncbi:MAG: C39 family peptidase [Candidatus Saganbacteria bacterium]|nr:C39 family peptidase [Candidatus Saganbacteria bacterium]